MKYNDLVLYMLVLRYFCNIFGDVCYIYIWNLGERGGWEILFGKLGVWMRLFRELTFEGKWEEEFIKEIEMGVGGEIRY